jgi:colicin import membrane protein
MAAVLSRPDRQRSDLASFGWSLGAHALLLLAIAVGGFVWPGPEQPPTLGIEAVVLDSRDLKPATRRPAPKPDPAEQQRAVERRQAEELALAEQRQAAEAERRLAEQRRAEEANRVAAEARQAEQAAQAEAEQRTRQQEAAKAAAKAAASKAAAERAAAEKAAAKANAEKAAAAQAARDKAAAEAKAAAAKATAEAQRRQAAADLARQLADEERLASAADSGALAEYVDLIRQKVERNWIPPASARPGLECEVLVNQLPGGAVGDVRVGRCNGDEAVRRSIETAVRRADPLPLPSDPTLFERNLRFTFKPEE